MWHFMEEDPEVERIETKAESSPANPAGEEDVSEDVSDTELDELLDRKFFF